MNKLRLEQPTIADAEEIYDLVDYNRQRFAQWFSWVDDMNSVDDEVEFIVRALTEPDLELYCIKIENQIVGMIDLHEINREDKSAEVGYWIDETFEGLGIVSNLVGNLEEYIDDAPDIERLKLIVNQDNIRSINVAQRADFEFTHIEEQEIVYQRAFN